MRKLRKPFIFIAVAALVLCCCGLMTSADKTESTKIISRDPNAYKDMAQFFEKRYIQGDDVIGAAEALPLEESLLYWANSGELPESPLCVSLMQSLDNCTELSKVTDKMDAIAQAFSDNIKKNTAAPSDTLAENAEFGTDNTTYVNALEFAPESVIANYKNSLMKYPGHLDGRNNLGLTYMHCGYDFSAMMEFMVILKLNPKYEGAKLNLALMYEKLGMTDIAYSYMLDAAEASPGWFAADYNLGLLENQRGNFGEAEKYLNKALADLDGITTDNPVLEDAMAMKAKITRMINTLETGKALPDEDKNTLRNELQSVSPTPASTVLPSATSTAAATAEPSATSSAASPSPSPSVSPVTAPGEPVKAYAPAAYLVFLWIFTVLYFILMLRAYGNERNGCGKWGLFSFVIMLVAAITASGKSEFTTDNYIFFMVAGGLNVFIMLGCGRRKY